MEKEKIFQELLENDPHRNEFSDEKWSEWAIIFTRIIGPDICYSLRKCDAETYASMQDIWLKSGINEVQNALDARKAIQEFK